MACGDDDETQKHILECRTLLKLNTDVKNLIEYEKFAKRETPSVGVVMVGMVVVCGWGRSRKIFWDDPTTLSLRFLMKFFKKDFSLNFLEYPFLEDDPTRQVSLQS